MLGDRALNGRQGRQRLGRARPRLAARRRLPSRRCPHRGGRGAGPARLRGDCARARRRAAAPQARRRPRQRLPRARAARRARPGAAHGGEPRHRRLRAGDARRRASPSRDLPSLWSHGSLRGPVAGAGDRRALRRDQLRGDRPRRRPARHLRALLVSDLAQVFLLALFAMFNPTLLAAVTLMLLTPSPRRLMLGYLLGAYLTSISSGLVIVFALSDSSAASASNNSLSPSADIVVGLLLLLVAFALATDRDRPLRDLKERRKQKKLDANHGEQKEALPMRLLGRGSPRVAFAVGLLLSFPGLAYLTGLSHIHKLDAGALPTALLVIAFCLIQQLLLEIPLVSYLLAPEETAGRVDRFRAWLSRNGRQAAIIGAAVLGTLVIIRGIAGLV